MPTNFKKKFARLNAIAHQKPAWYCHYDKKTGSVLAIKNHTNDSDDFFEITNNVAAEFNSGKEHIINYFVVWNKQEKKYKLEKKDSAKIENLKNNFVEITCSHDDAEIHIIKDFQNKIWKICVTEDLYKQYDKIESVASDYLYFSITSKGDPHLLYRTLIVNIKDLLDNTVIIPFDNNDFLNKNYSIYTNKKFDSYTIKEF